MPFADRDDGSIFYVSKDTTRLYRYSTARAESPRDPIISELLWGDRVRLERNRDGSFREEGGRCRARARGRYGWLDRAHLGTRSLLEFYFIDVGQGDGVFIRTPNGRHLLIDGGYPRQSQPTGKNAADFVDWKFIRDYESPDKSIELDAMICTHNDHDHYGGLEDLLDPEQLAGGQAVELDAQRVFVERFYHAGLSWWKTSTASRTLGPVAATTRGPMYTLLLHDRPSLDAGLASGALPRLQGFWANFLDRVRGARTRAGDPTPVERLSHLTQHLPGFGPAAAASGATPEPAIRVLAPVEFEVDGAPAVRNYGSADGNNTNGNSVLLRIECGNVRVILTGDLNTKSQAALLEDYTGEADVFDCDVAKACHHGSADVSFAFLEAMAPSVTVISSGDSEGHDHPRPEIIAASALTGHREIRKDKIVTPLIYLTELARSVQIGRLAKVSTLDAAGSETGTLDLAALRATARVTMAGDLNPTTETRPLRGGHIVTGLVYGLINVRTDGKRILCAALNEKSRTWNVAVVKPKPRGA
jgi:beta-lactamase superfamily II metal-dependent hydrolase